MIEDFVRVLRNGMCAPPGKLVAGVPVMDQINNPAFEPVAYRWASAGTTHEIEIDGSTVVEAIASPDGQSVVVLEDFRLHSPDNVRVLSADAVEQLRLRNPYPESAEYQPGDRYGFTGVSVRGQFVIVEIQVTRDLPHREQNALPMYDATYDPADWHLCDLAWKPWA